MKWNDIVPRLRLGWTWRFRRNFWNEPQRQDNTVDPQRSLADNKDGEGQPANKDSRSVRLKENLKVIRGG